MTEPSALDLIELFDHLVADVDEALANQDEWGPSGGRDGQYAFDLVADDVIVAPLVDAGLRVLTEESGLSGEGAITVVVDPIDGSTNASHGLPWYATSLCAVDEEGPLASVVVNLATGERFAAIRNEGIEADIEEFGPSGVTELGEALLAFSGLPPSHGGWRQFRAYGACALDLCAVAAGTWDGFVDVDNAHGVWDYLGALLICQEAGVAVADGAGEELVVLDHAARRGPVAAATPELLDALLSMRSGWDAH